jgi:hypothetical protein
MTGSLFVARHDDRYAAQGDEGGRDIRCVGVAVLQVRVAHNLGDPAGAEDDVTAHDCPPSFVLSRTGRTAVRAVTATAPLLPKMVNCSLTSMPAA